MTRQIALMEKCPLPERAPTILIRGVLTREIDRKVAGWGPSNKSIPGHNKFASKSHSQTQCDIHIRSDSRHVRSLHESNPNQSDTQQCNKSHTHITHNNCKTTHATQHNKNTRKIKHEQ